MKPFYQLDENNVVTNVIVVSNDDTSDNNGVESEGIGVEVLSVNNSLVLILTGNRPHIMVTLEFVMQVLVTHTTKA